MFHKLRQRRLLPDTEDAVVSSFLVEQVIALVAVERILQDDMHGHVQMGLAPLFATDLLETFLLLEPLDKLTTTINGRHFSLRSGRSAEAPFTFYS